MFLERGSIFTVCCLVASLIGLGETEARKSRSIIDVTHRPLGTSRLNSIDVEDRNYRRDYDRQDRSNATSSIDDDESRRIRDEEEKWFAVIMAKDYQVSTPAEIADFDRIGERMIARANLTEEAKRVVRQVKRQRPGFFWTLARVAFETVNETRSAVQQISSLVEGNFIPETTTTSRELPTSSTTTDGNTTESTTTTTTEAPFRLTLTQLETLVRRNVRGLIRLFNVEWRDAVNQSQKNVRDFQRDLGNRIGPFLEDNPNVV